MNARKLYTMAITAVAMGVTACGPSITSDRDPTVPIPVGATYAITGGADVGEERDPNLQSQIVHQRIQTALNNEMQAKGFKLATEPAAAAFTIRYYLQIQTSVSYATTAGGYGGRYGGYGWGYGGGMAVVPLTSTEGGLVIDLLSSSSGKQAWRGLIKGNVPDKAPSQEQVDNVMKQVFAKLQL
jgi:hypothetical protein